MCIVAAPINAVPESRGRVRVKLSVISWLGGGRRGNPEAEYEQIELLPWMRAMQRKAHNHAVNILKYSYN